MSSQEIAAAAAVAVALAYLVVRYARRRASGNCCGEKDCPATAGVVDKLKSHKR